MSTTDFSLKSPLDTHHKIYVDVKVDQKMRKTKKLPTYTIHVTMVNVTGEWSNVTGSFIVDAEIGPRVSTCFKHLHINEMISKVQEWFRQSDVELDARTQISDCILKMLKENSYKCPFVLECLMKYDISDILCEYKSTVSKKNDNETCAICLKDYEVGDDTNKMLHCDHHFHHGCIVNWTKTNNSCPLCRSSVISYLY